jgi:hypothetical protein
MPYDVSKPWPEYPYYACKLCKIIRKILGASFFCDFFSSRKSIYKVVIVINGDIDAELWCQ